MEVSIYSTVSFIASVRIFEIEIHTDTTFAYIVTKYRRKNSLDIFTHSHKNTLTYVRTAKDIIESSGPSFIEHMIHFSNLTKF